MKRRFARRNDFVKSSQIREILKVTEQPEMISFAGGLPAPELFPVEDIKKACIEVLNTNGQASLQYATTEGYTPLREKVCQRLKRLGIDSDIDNIIITTGSQQGIDLSGKVFIDEGDTVVCESPTYLAAINAFRAFMPKFAEVKMDEEGMDMEDLERILKETPNVKFIYSIPDFQNPTGRTMSISRRKKMIELANRYDVIIIEDNPYGEIRFAGEKVPPLKHFDTQGRVIYLSTFSKILSPGLRLGWVCADKEFIERYVPFKQNADLHTSIFTQMVADKYLEIADVEKHIQKIRDSYRHRRELMIKCMDEEFPKCMKHTVPDGGLFIWAQLPEGMDANKLLKISLENKVAFVPGESFYPNSGFKNMMRLNYSSMTDEKIIEGIKRLAKVIKENM